MKIVRVPYKNTTTRFIQKVPGLLPLLKCLMSDPNRNYMWRKTNNRPVIRCKIMNIDYLLTSLYADKVIVVRAHGALWNVMLTSSVN